MPSTNTSTQSPVTKSPAKSPKFDISAGAHMPFSAIEEAVKDRPLANFVEQTMNLCQGIRACLEIVHASEMDRDYNRGASPGQEKLPAVDATKSDVLLRFSITVAGMLADAAEEQVEWINEYGAAQLKPNSWSQT